MRALTRTDKASPLRALVSAATIAALLAASACTTFQPVAGDPVIGSQIRTDLTPEGQIRQASATGVARLSLVGSVLSVDPDAIVLVVPIPGIVPELQRSPKVADTLRIPMADVTGVAEQQFSASRSALLTGGVVAGGILGVLLAGHIGSSEGGTEDPTNRQAFRPGMTILRIPIGR